MTDDKLMPCPFCGGEAYMDVVREHKPYARVACNGDCMAEMTESGKTDAEAIANVTGSWNRRAPSPATAGVTIQMVDAFREAFNEAGRGQADSVWLDRTNASWLQVRAGLSAALSDARMLGE